MTWWKIGIIGTAIWLVGVIGVGAAVVISAMKSHPHNPNAADAQAQQAGQAVGAISAPILAGIWFFAWRRRQVSPPVDIQGTRIPRRREP